MKVEVAQILDASDGRLYCVQCWAAGKATHATVIQDGKTLCEPHLRVVLTLIAGGTA